LCLCLGEMLFHTVAVCLTLGAAAQSLQRIEAEAEEARHWHEREVPNDPRHRMYYYNDQTRQTSWELPNVENMGAQVTDPENEEQYIPTTPQVAAWKLSGEIYKDYHPQPSAVSPPTPVPAEEASAASLISKHLNQEKSSLLTKDKGQPEAKHDLKQEKSSLLTKDKGIVVKFKIKNKAGKPPPPPLPKSWPPPMGFLPPFMRKKAPKLVAQKKKKKKGKPSPILGVWHHGHLVQDEKGLEEIIREEEHNGHGAAKLPASVMAAIR